MARHDRVVAASPPLTTTTKDVTHENATAICARAAERGFVWINNRLRVSDLRHVTVAHKQRLSSALLHAFEVHRPWKKQQPYHTCAHHVLVGWWACDDDGRNGLSGAPPRRHAFEARSDDDVARTR